MIAWFATKGTGTNEALRMQTLLSQCGPLEEWTFDKKNKRESFFELLKRARSARPELIVMEGTGIAGGLLCLIARILWRVPYVFSSGDAVGPFIGAHHPALGGIFTIYERLLCKFAAGFIGWTPYLSGRAIGFGCPRAMTAAGWSIGNSSPASGARERIRRELGIPDSVIVIGIAGALEWNPARSYCYGCELVRAVRDCSRNDLAIVIVGDGSGREVLRREAAGDARIFLPGAVPLNDVVDWLSAMDLAILPQSLDAVGMFRYTTKISEYAAARLPVLTLQTPMVYDFDADWMWRLPGESPWDPAFLGALTTFMNKVNPGELAAKREQIPTAFDVFDREKQIRRTARFIADILAKR